jgi:hypothetical protein
MQITAKDPEYLDPAPDNAEDKDICDEESVEGYFCTRWRFHKDDHAAHTPDGRQVYRWKK